MESSEQLCTHGVRLIGGFCGKCIEVMCREAAPGPNELEMHRLAYRMCKEAGFDGPEELLAAYKHAESKISDLSEKIEDMRSDMSTLWSIGAKCLLERP